jgi:hypothetical protein
LTQAPSLGLGAHWVGTEQSPCTLLYSTSSLYHLICMYTCMYTCTCIRIYVYTYVYMYVCIHVCMHVCIHTCMHACMGTQPSPRSFLSPLVRGTTLYACIHVCMYIRTYTCMVGTQQSPCSFLHSSRLPFSVKRDLAQCQKRPSSVSKET